MIAVISGAESIGPPARCGGRAAGPTLCGMTIETEPGNSTTSPTSTDRPRRPLVGNRLVLTGAIMYLLEWVAIVAGHVGVPLGATVGAAGIARAYGGHADSLGWAAGWFGVVLLGRVLIMTGLRSALADSHRPQRLMDLAVAAMALSVALETCVYAVAAGASWSLGAQGSLAAARSLDAVASQLNHVLYGPLGVSLVAAGIAMWRSGLFPRTLAALGTVAGVLSTLIGLALAAPRFSGAADALSSVALLFWVWMIWTGVVLWRARRSG